MITLADHHRKTVSRGGTSPRYIPSANGASGHLVYTSKTTLFAVPFDLDKLETRGTAFPVLDDVAFHGFFGTAQLSLSRGGTLVYRRSMGQSLLRVEWLDSAGKTQPLLAKPGVYGRPSLSPDGQRLALEVEDGSGTDIWVYDWRRDTMTRLTYSRTASVPVWSPDGRYIICSSGLRDDCHPFRRGGQTAASDPEHEQSAAVVLYRRRKAAGIPRGKFEDLL